MDILEKEITYKKELVCILTTCTFILVLKFFITTIILSKKSAQVGNRTKEDFRGADFEYDKVTQEAKDDEQRWWFIQLNDMENFPFALIVFWTSSLIVHKSKSRLTLCILFPLYAFLRIFHTLMFSSKYFLPRFLAHLFSVISFWIASFVGIVDSYINLTSDDDILPMIKLV